MLEAVPKPPMSAGVQGPYATERLLDSHEAAALLKVHPRTLQRLAQRGEIAGIQVGKLWRFRASSIDAWIQQRLAS